MVIRKLQPYFGRYGQPEVMTTDNGQQFTSAEFGKFAAEWNFEHRTSSPNHQQENGRAEAAVKIAKNLIRKAHAAGQDPYKALLAYRNTLQEGLHYSPSQLFLGRRTRTSLPTSSTLLQLQQPSHLKTLMQRRQDGVRKKHDRKAKPLPVLEEGDNVQLKPTHLGSKVWVKGSGAKRLDERSYLVETNDKILRRNWADLRKLKVPNHQPVTSQRRAVSEEPPEPRAVQPDFTPSEQPQKTREEMKHEATKRMEAPRSRSRMLSLSQKPLCNCDGQQERNTGLTI